MIVVLGVLLSLWLIWSPRSPDLAAQVYRAHLVSLDGFSLWDDNWYAGHYLPAYSLLIPALTMLVGVHWIGVAAVTLSTYCFSRLASLHFGANASRASVLFALSATGDLFIGRITFATGVSLALLALLAEVHGRHFWAALAAVACAAASPVAGLFLALAAVTDLVCHKQMSRAILLGVPSLLLIGTLTILFPEGGEEPFGVVSLLAACTTTALLLIALPARELVLRRGTWLYLAVLLLCYLIPSPVGSNSVRLGVLFAPAIFAGAVDVERVAAIVASAVASLAPRRGRPPGQHRSASRALPRLLFGATLLWLIGWQINGPLAQSLSVAVDPSTRISYYTPLIGFLRSHSRVEPLRIEVPFTSSHWDAAILARSFALARGWERQLDTRDNSLFYEGQLTAAAYRAWLLSKAVRYVALPDARLDYSSRQEAELIRSGLPFLRQVLATRHWRVYEVLGARPLASGPGHLVAMSNDSFTLQARKAGGFLVRIHYNPYWRVTAGQASVSEAAGGWTYVSCPAGGVVTIEASLS